MNNSTYPDDYEDFGTSQPSHAESPHLLRHSMEWTVLLIIAYSVIFIVGFIGNMSVVLVILRTKSMKTVTNLFILNLAIADLLVIIFCIPPTLLSNILIPWVLGWWMCKTVNYVQGVSVCASVYSLVAISLDKFLGIWFPMKKGMAKRRARIIIGLIWVIACVVILPWALVFDLKLEGPAQLTFCVEIWPDEVTGDLYFLLGNLLACYLLPLGGISLCYALIWFRVIQRKVPKETASVANVKKIHRKTKYGVLKMLMIVILVFLLSWLPLYVIFTRIKFAERLEDWEDRLYSIATPLAQWLGSSNSCINPILYTFLNAKFRKAFLHISSCNRRKQKKVPTLQRRHAIKSSYHVRKHVSFGGITGV